MQINVTFRHMESSGALKGYVEHKITRLSKLFYQPMEANVVLSVEKHRHRAEISLKGDRTMINGVQEKEDMYEAIDLALDKIERQVKQYKSKLRDRKRGREARQTVLAEKAGKGVTL